MAKTVLALLVFGLVALASGQAQAQVYRYNPQTGQTDSVSVSAPTATQAPNRTNNTPAIISTPPRPHTVQPQQRKAPTPTVSDEELTRRLLKVVAEEKEKEILPLDEDEYEEEEVLDGIPDEDTPVSTFISPSKKTNKPSSLIDSVNKAIAAEETKYGRKMLPLGRVGIILDPEGYNATIERNAAELNKIPDLDKLFLTPPALMSSLMFLMEWQKLAGVEFMTDTDNMVQKKYGINKIPGFVYLRPDGVYNTYSLDDLAPFYDALTVQRRKVGK